MELFTRRRAVSRACALYVRRVRCRSQLSKTVSSATVMSDMDIISVSKLISLVRERPVLWDRQEEVYKNRKLTRKAWSEICETLVDNYIGLSEQDKKSVARNVIGKWANLRDNWLRYWRKRQDVQRIGSSTRSLKKYIHHDQLLFLSKVYDAEIQQEVEEIQVEVDVISDPEIESPLGLTYEDMSHTMWNSQSADIDVLMKPEPQLEQHAYFFHNIMPMIYNFDENEIEAFHSAVLESIRKITYSNTESLSLVQTVQTPPEFHQSQDSLGKKEELSKKKSQGTSTFDDMSKYSNQLKIDLDIRTEFNKSQTSAIETNDKDISNENALSIECSEKPEERFPLQLPKSESNNVEADFTNLKSVVNKLEEISKKISTSSLGDSYDRFGKYVGSLLRGLPHGKVRTLKRKIVKDILRAKRLKRRQRAETLGRTATLNMTSEFETLQTPNLGQTLQIATDNSLRNLSCRFTTLQEKDLADFATCLPSPKKSRTSLIHDCNSVDQQGFSSDSVQPCFDPPRGVLVLRNIPTSADLSCFSHSVSPLTKVYQKRMIQ